MKDKKTVGLGTYGMSFYGTYGPTKRKIVIKQLYSMDADPQRLQRVQAELVLLTRITGKFISTPIGFILNKPITVATEYMPMGSLYSALHDPKTPSLTATQKTIIALCVAYGMRRLHKQKVVHGDLKSSNILLDEGYIPKISDFGIIQIAKKYSASTKANLCCPFWWAPELFSNNAITEYSDIYSFGILIYEMVTNTLPFEGKTAQELKSILNDPTETLPMPDDIQPVLSALIQACLKKNCNERPSFRKIYRLFKTKQAYFPGTDFSAVDQIIAEIKAQRHKSKDNLVLINGSKIPTRSDFGRVFATKNGNMDNSRSVKMRYLHLPHHKESVMKFVHVALKPGMMFPKMCPDAAENEKKEICPEKPTPKVHIGLKTGNLGLGNLKMGQHKMGRKVISKVTADDISELPLSKELISVP